MSYRSQKPWEREADWKLQEGCIFVRQSNGRDEIWRQCDQLNPSNALCRQLRSYHFFTWRMLRSNAEEFSILLINTITWSIAIYVLLSAMRTKLNPSKFVPLTFFESPSFTGFDTTMIWNMVFHNSCVVLAVIHVDFKEMYVIVCSACPTSFWYLIRFALLSSFVSFVLFC